MATFLTIYPNVPFTCSLNVENIFTSDEPIIFEIDCAGIVRLAHVTSQPSLRFELRGRSPASRNRLTRPKVLARISVIIRSSRLRSWMQRPASRIWTFAMSKKPTQSNRRCLKSMFPPCSTLATMTSKITERRITNRWTRAAGATLATCLVRRRVL